MGSGQIKRGGTNAFYSALLLLLLAADSSGQTCSQTTGCAPPLGSLTSGRAVNATSGYQDDDPLICSELNSPSCLNDGDFNTRWSSDRVLSPSIPVFVTLDFPQSVTIENTSVWFVQRITQPKAFVLERSVDFGQSWTAYRYYAANCLSTFGMNATNIFSSPSNTIDAICVEVWSTIDQIRADFTIKSQFSTDADAATISRYRTVTNIRLKLVTPDPILMNYEISEWSIIGSCMCNGHASQCVPFPGDANTPAVYSGCSCEHNTVGDHCEKCAVGYNNLPWKPGNATAANACQKCNCNNHSVDCAYNDTLQSSTCNCTDNTKGENCELCLQGFYHDPLLPLSDPATCSLCRCDPGGTNGVCDSVGRCSCKANVQGLTCSSCISGFWNLSADNVLGCQACTCDPRGTLNGNTCDPNTGKCTCKDSLFVGNDCGKCQSGYYMTLMPASPSAAMCLPCQCNMAGSLSSVCDGVTSQCPCKAGITGLRCDIILPGFFIKTLDAIIFEAENASLSNGVTCCSFPVYYTGAGYVTFANDSAAATFAIKVPRDDAYMVILRYQYSSAASIKVEININSVVPLEIIAVELNPTGSTNGFINAGLANLSSSLQYTIIVQQQTIGTWNLDSIVLMPLEFNASASTSLGGVNCLPSAASPLQISIECWDVVFNLSLTFFNQTYACNCDVSNPSCPCNKAGGGSCLDYICCPPSWYISDSTCIPCGCSKYSNSSQCDQNGQCPCPFGFQGLTCDSCSHMHHNLSAGCPPCSCDVPDCNCIECVCSGKSSTCSADLTNYSEAVVKSDFLTLCASSPDCVDGWVFISESGQPTPPLLGGTGLHYVLLNTDDILLKAPEKFLGNQARSLGLNITLVVMMTSALQPQYIRLTGKYRSGALIGMMDLNTAVSTYTIPLKEGYWQWNGTSGPYANITDLIAVLSFLTEFSFSAHFSSDIIEEAIIQSVSLYTFVEKNAPTLPYIQIIPGVFHVENCVCPQEYSGQFCQLCSSGYARISQDPTDTCQKCNCNGLSTTCDPDTGICSKCTGNSTGSHCESCLPGYYGNITQGIPCLPCGCLHTNPNVTHTCTLEIDGLPNCGPCDNGYSGRKCDQCTNGYYGISTVGICVPCNCNSNVDPSLGLTCNPVTGECLNCTNHTMGSHCELCLPGFYGNISAGVPCKACGCGIYSSSPNCDQSTGQCSCIGWAYGKTCNQCPPGYDETNGCELCPACYQLINQALTHQATFLFSQKNTTDGMLQLFSGYSKNQIETLIGDINSTLQRCLWPMSLNTTALTNNVHGNESLYLTVNGSLTSMIKIYDSIITDIATALSMLRKAENFVWGFNTSMLGSLYNHSVALNQTAISLLYTAGNCSMDIEKLSVDIDALWNGSEVLNLNLAGLLGVLNATYAQAFSYAGLIQQLNISLYEIQSSIAAITLQAKNLNTSSYALDGTVKDVTTSILLSNLSLIEARQMTIDILRAAGVLQEYIKKIGDSIRKASERSLIVLNATSGLLNDTVSIHGDALQLNDAAVTSQSDAQTTIVNFNTTSNYALNLLQTSFPFLEYAVNLSRIINNSRVSDEDITALSINATDILQAADIWLAQALNISSSVNILESLVSKMEPSVNLTVVAILMLQSNISTLQQLVVDLNTNIQSATATTSMIHDIYIQVTNVLSEVNRTIQGLDASYEADRSELNTLLTGILQNFNASKFYWMKMEQLAASFTNEAEMAYNGAVDNNDATQALLAYAATLTKLPDSPTAGKLQELLTQFQNEMAEIDNLTATSAQLQKELEELTAYFSRISLDLDECYKTP